MRSSTLLSSLAFCGAAFGRIVGIAAPSTIAPGANFTITIITENYIQSVLDVSAAFGLSSRIEPDSLGTYLTSIYLGPSKSNILTNITVPATVPSGTPPGSYDLIGAINSLYGAASSPTTTLFDLPVTISNTTSALLVSTLNGTDSCTRLNQFCVLRTDR
jgi:hypothetical protein